MGAGSILVAVTQSDIVCSGWEQLHDLNWGLEFTCGKAACRYKVLSKRCAAGDRFDLASMAKSWLCSDYALLLPPTAVDRISQTDTVRDRLGTLFSRMSHL
eukprot:NODE_2676_length_456_cov_224.237237_g2655_i0.p1 GENE.NODE_2676_length_456_cov_224.237237_g2655_i0~~NODE_2676_length_456_cov_224.237237_g2655_i0.p1  ORF type:complete len:101 (-),score=2.39 NODE_2676_length_456_cov_224.237237_g2655_i0:85-387(-)